MTWTLDLHRAHLATEPSADGLRALAAALGRGSRVVRARRLGGGIGSATSVVDVVDRAGRARAVVLKRYPPPAGDGVREEWERLVFAQTIDVPSPEPLALDAQGAWFGCPSIVMSRVPGRPSLSPPPPDAWIDSVARALAALDAVDVGRARGALATRARPWKRPPSDGWGPLYQRAIEAVEHALPKRSRARVLCHEDFHPGNMLFERARLSGVVDWSSARVGPRSYDLAYCRTEVAMLFGGDEPDRLARAYASATGRAPSDLPLWDLVCALSARRWSHHWLKPYHEQGRRDLTLRHFRSRLRAFTARALAEV